MRATVRFPPRIQAVCGAKPPWMMTWLLQMAWPWGRIAGYTYLAGLDVGLHSKSHPIWGGVCVGGGRPAVSIAMRNRPTRHAITVSNVYTLPEFRGKGLRQRERGGVLPAGIGTWLPARTCSPIPPTRSATMFTRRLGSNRCANTPGLTSGNNAQTSCRL